MAEKLQTVRGTHDILPDEAVKFRFVIERTFSIALCYGYGEIITPIFEFSDVFHRTLGDTSDVVTKETYSFTDRGGENLTLRPEFTASIARAFISGSMQDQLPLRFFYAGPAFRYERPQKGRQRQFNQIGAELLGVATPPGDIETIALAYQVLSALGLKDKVKLEINTLGDPQSRASYRAALIDYFRTHEAGLSPDSKARLERNPLRILDSKDEADKKINAGAPPFAAHMTPEAQAYFAEVTAGLDALGIPWTRNTHLVRGLDYYNHTVFEFTTDLLGAQGTVLAGGRYDGLIEQMGGAPTPGIGWAAGIERLVALIDFENHSEFVKPIRPISLIPLGQEAELLALRLANELRSEMFHVKHFYKRNLSSHMKKANKANACVAVIFGDSEIAHGALIVKDLDTATQTEIKRENVISALAPYRNRR